MSLSVCSNPAKLPSLIICRCGYVWLPIGIPRGFASSSAPPAAARMPATAASVAVFLKNSRLEIAAMNASRMPNARSDPRIPGPGPGSLQLPNSDVAILHVSLESARFARRRPLQADGTSLLPLRLSGIGRIVRHVADLLSIQGDGDMRALGRDLQVIPLLFLPKTRELVVAGVEPEHVVLRPEPFRRDAVHDDADVFTRFATADVHLIAGAERDAAVIRAGLVDACVRLLRS